MGFDGASGPISMVSRAVGGSEEASITFNWLCVPIHPP